MAEFLLINKIKCCNMTFAVKSNFIPTTCKDPNSDTKKKVHFPSSITKEPSAIIIETSKNSRRPKAKNHS